MREFVAIYLYDTILSIYLWHWPCTADIIFTQSGSWSYFMSQHYCSISADVGLVMLCYLTLNEGLKKSVKLHFACVCLSKGIKRYLDIYR